MGQPRRLNASEYASNAGWSLSQMCVRLSLAALNGYVWDRGKGH